MNYSLFNFGEEKNTANLASTLDKTVGTIRELTETLNKAVSINDFTGIGYLSSELLVLSVKAEILAPLVKYLEYEDVSQKLETSYYFKTSYYEVLLDYFIHELNTVHNPTSGSTSKLENDKLEIKRAYLTNSLSELHQNRTIPAK